MAIKTLNDLINEAIKGVTIEGQLIQSANTPVVGGTLYCSHRYRNANSRGPKRGRGFDVRFLFKADGEKYSKDISKARALEILRGEG